MDQILPCQPVGKAIKIFHQQAPSLHLLIGLWQFMRFVNNERTIVPQHRVPTVLPMDGVRQKVVVVADLYLEPAVRDLV